MNLSASPNSFNQQSQPAGVPAPAGTRGSGGAVGSDAALLALHARLCELQPDADARAALLGVPATVDASWLSGRMLPVLRARRAALTTAVASLEHQQRA
jgi:hypothetical protein